MRSKVASRICAAVLCLILSFVSMNARIAADEQVLASNVLIVDENGITADSSSGEFYVRILDMKPGTTYVKNISIYNFEDQEIKLYMKAVPVSQEGNINLYELCTTTLRIGSRNFYEGSANGIGNIDMQNDAYELVTISAGQQSTLNFTAQIPKALQEGQEGKIQFKWIFSAVKTEKPQPPVTGVILYTVLYVLVGSLAIGLLAVYILFTKRKRQSAAASRYIEMEHYADFPHSNISKSREGRDMDE